MVTYLGSLVQCCCGEGGTLQTNITGMCGECSHYMGHTGFAPAHSVCAFPDYTAQSPGCSAGELSEVGPGLHALPRSKPLRFRFLGTPQRHTRLGLRFVPFPGPSSSGDQVLGGCTVPRCVVRLITSPSQPLGFLGGHRCIFSGVASVSSGELISGCNPPGGCQPSRIPGSLG